MDWESFCESFDAECSAPDVMFLRWQHLPLEPMHLQRQSRHVGSRLCPSGRVRTNILAGSLRLAKVLPPYARLSRPLCSLAASAALPGSRCAAWPAQEDRCQRTSTQVWRCAVTNPTEAVHPRQVCPLRAAAHTLPRSVSLRRSNLISWRRNAGVIGPGEGCAASCSACALPQFASISMALI